MRATRSCGDGGGVRGGAFERSLQDQLEGNGRDFREIGGGSEPWRDFLAVGAFSTAPIACERTMFRDVLTANSDIGPDRLVLGLGVVQRLCFVGLFPPL